MPKDKQDITLKDVIAHIQGVKQELQEEIRGVKNDVSSLRSEVGSLRTKMDEGFKEAKEHREALQEDRMNIAKYKI